MELAYYLKSLRLCLIYFKNVKYLILKGNKNRVISCVRFFIFQQKKALKILRKFFLFHLKQCFGSWDIQILVIFLITAKTFET